MTKEESPRREQTVAPRGPSRITSNTLLPSVRALRTWTKKTPVALPETPEEIHAQLKRLARAEKVLRREEIALSINWYVHHRTQLLRATPCTAKFVARPAATAEMEYAWSMDEDADSSRFSTTRFISILFTRVNTRVFDHFHRNPVAAGQREMPYYGSVLEYLPADYRVDILRRLIVETRRLSTLIKRVEKHSIEHSNANKDDRLGGCNFSYSRAVDRLYRTDPRINAAECRQTVELWRQGPATFGTAVESLVRELIEALRRMFRAKLRAIPLPDDYGEAKSVGDAVKKALKAGNRTKSRDAERAQQAAINELNRLRALHPHERKAILLSMMLKEKVGNKYRWGGKRSLCKYCKFIDWSPVPRKSSEAN